MATNTETARTVEALSEQRYKYGFVTDIEADSAPPGLNEEIVRFISAKKGEESVRRSADDHNLSIKHCNITPRTSIGTSFLLFSSISV